MEIQHQQPFFDTEVCWLLFSKDMNPLFEVKQSFLCLGCDSALVLQFTDHCWFVPDPSARQNVGSP